MSITFLINYQHHEFIYFFVGAAVTKHCMIKKTIWTGYEFIIIIIINIPPLSLTNYLVQSTISFSNFHFLKFF